MLKLLGIKSSRGTRLSINFMIVLSVWYYFFNLELGQSFAFTMSAFPYWLLITFGSYALWKVGTGLASLRDCVAESAELDTEIKQAKEYLSKKGLKFT